MKRLTLTSSSLLLLALGLLSQVGQSAPLPAWSAVDTGIDYQEWTLADPNDVYVARMDRSNTSVTLESMLGQGKINGGTEVVTNMANRYDQAINYWGQNWGQRNRVAVAINGSFFNPTTGVIDGGQVHSSWYAKRFIDFGPSGFAWNLNGATFIGECVRHVPNKQLITYPATGGSQTFQGIGVPRGGDELIIYTPQYDANTGTDNSGVEVLVELNRPALLMPSPNYVSGYVRQIRDGQGSTPIPFDHVVLSATGTARTALLANVSVGDEIRISQEIKSLTGDCSTNMTYDWTKTYASIEGSYIFLKNGVVQSFTDPGATTRNPRTAICYNDTHVFYMVVDGRRVDSVGMTTDEMGNFAKNTLGATWCINQDGGGSSTMVVNGVVKNVPSDGSLRAVANGMLMVVVEPKQASTTFLPDDVVKTTASTAVRLGPGTNYAALTTVAQNTQGTVLGHMNGLDGVLATGSNWWKVDFSGTAGWVDEANLLLVSPGPTATPTNTPFPTMTSLPTVTPTNTPAPTNTPLPTNTATDTPAPTSTPLPTNTATNTPLPTNTSTDTPAPTSTATDTPLPTNTSTDTPAPTNTATNTPLPTNTATDTPAPSNTPAPTSTATDTPLPTNTSTDTPAPTNTATNTPLPTNTATDTPAPSNTPLPTNTATSTPLPTSTATNTQLPTNTATDTPLPTSTATATDTALATSTSTPTATDTPVPTATSTATLANTAAPTNTSVAATNTPKPTSAATSTSKPAPTNTPTRTPFGGGASPTPPPGGGATATPTPTATASASATATLTPTPTSTGIPGNAVHIGDLDGRTKNYWVIWSAYVTVSVHNLNHHPVENAVVRGGWNRGWGGQSVCITGADGKCQVRRPILIFWSRWVSYVVQDVVHPTLDYQPLANHDPDGSSNGTTIDVPRP